MSIVNIMPLLPLQADITAMQWTKNETSTDAIIFVIGVVVIIAVLIIINSIRKKNPMMSGDISRKSTSSSSGGRSSSVTGQRLFSGFAFRRLAKNIGLDHDQTKMFEFVLRSDSVADPERSIKNPELLDRHFRRAYRIIDQSSSTDEEAQERLALLFSTRNLLENVSGSGLASTRQLQENTTTVLHVGKEKYNTAIISSKGENLAVERPENALGSPINIPRGNKLNIVVFTKNNKGFSFESRVLGYSTTQGLPSMLLAHSSQLKMLSHRRFRRKQSVIACMFFFVYVEGSGKKQRLIVDKRRLTGNIMDISVGGCSIKTTAPVAGGARLKIEFTQGDITAAALGQVLRTNRTGINTIIHIKFLRAAVRTMNTINAYVYDYAYE